MATWLHKQQMGYGITLRSPLWKSVSWEIPRPWGPLVTPESPHGDKQVPLCPDRKPLWVAFIGSRQESDFWEMLKILTHSKIYTLQDTSAKLPMCPCDFPSHYTAEGSGWKSFPISYCLFILQHNPNQSKAREQETFWHTFCSLSPVLDFTLNQPKGRWVDGGGRWAAGHEAPRWEQRPQCVCWNRGCPLYKVIAVQNEHLGNETASRSKRSHRTEWGECTISEKAMWWLEEISDLYIPASK